MAFRQITQYSPLKWYNSDELTFYERYGQWGARFVDPVPMNQVAPFQLSRAQTGNQISYFRLTNQRTAVTVDVTAEIKAAGLRVDEFATEGYDLITYPGTVKILGLSLTEDVYQATMSDGVNTWKSECFNMVDDSDLMQYTKITWCNNDPIPYDGGALNYKNGFKHVIYIDAKIRSPTYPLVTVGTTRQTVNQYSQIMAYKQYAFLLTAPEYLLDTIHFISPHSEILIESEGISYDAKYFVMGEPTWPNDVGDVGEVEVTFRTKTLVIKTAGNGTDCAIPDECVPLDFACKDLLVIGGTLHNAFQYKDSSNVTQNLADGDYILASTTGILGDPITVQQYNTGSYSNSLLFNGQIAKDESTGIYYYVDALSMHRPQITNYVNGTNTVTGTSLAGTIVEIYARANGVDFFMAAASDTDLATGVVIPTLPVSTDFLFLKVGSAICGNFFDSALFAVTTTACTLDLQGEYATVANAIAGGITAGQEWESDNSFTMGVPEGTVFEYLPVNSFNTYGDAIAAGVRDGECYALALSNPFGLPVDILCILNPATTYDDDAAAGVGGVAIGAEYYLSANNTYGLGFGQIAGIVKIRKS